jgi:cyclohexyl-isocyanide hydratase
MAFILFEGMTMLDFVGFYDAVTRLRMLKALDEVKWDFCALQEEVRDDRGLAMKAKRIRPDLAMYDLVFVPGGMATRQLKYDVEFVAWLQTARDVEYKVSVCTGALLLGAAGFLQGKRATTNVSALDFLKPYCSEVVKARVVRDGDVITGGGVAASIDLGLYVVECLTNAEVAKQVQKQMDYPYYQAGSGSDVYMPSG